MDSHKISLNLEDYPEIAAALAGASAGDTVKMKVTFIIDEFAEDVVVGSIESCSDYSVTPGPEDEKRMAKGEASEEATAPVLAVMAPGYKRK